MRAMEHSSSLQPSLTQRKACRHVSRGHLHTTCVCFSSACCAEYEEAQEVPLELFKNAENASMRLLDVEHAMYHSAAELSSQAGVEQ